MYQDSQSSFSFTRTIKSLGLFLALLAGSSGLNVAQAQITNPAVGSLGADATKASSGAIFIDYFIYLWNAAMVVGGLIVLLFFVQASIEWITAGGDSGKIQKARDRMMQSTIGLFILVFSFVIINFISSLLFGGTGFSVLNFSLPSATK